MRAVSARLCSLLTRRVPNASALAASIVCQSAGNCTEQGLGTHESRNIGYSLQYRRASAAPIVHPSQAARLYSLLLPGVPSLSSSSTGCAKGPMRGRTRRLRMASGPSKAVRMSAASLGWFGAAGGRAQWMRLRTLSHGLPRSTKDGSWPYASHAAWIRMSLRPSRVSSSFGLAQPLWA
jgi:hypothetical protein